MYQKRRSLRKKLICTILSVCIMLSFCGCSVNFLDPQTLMSPPKANADQQEIHKLLLQDSATDITFVYPKSGDYRSAIIMHDFTGDGTDDAIGFYLLETGGTEVQFLSEIEGKWQTIAKFKNPATQVDRVCFGDLTGDGKDEVLIGWGNTQNLMSATLCAYIYADKMITEIPIETSYGEMALTDFDDNGIMEIFLAQRQIPSVEESIETIPAKCDVVKLEGTAFVSVDTAEADNSIVIYSSISFGQITPYIKGVLLDGAKADSSMSTQVFYYNNDGEFINSPLGVNDENFVSPFSRPVGANFISRDINEDNITEIPIATYLPALPSGIKYDSTSFLVNWSIFNEISDYKIVLPALMNLQENYWFELPRILLGKVTAINDTSLRAVTYSEVITSKEEDVDDLIGSPLFTIRVFSKSAWEERGESRGYTKIAENNDTIYGILIQTNSEFFLRHITRIVDSFQIVTD